MSDSRTAAAPDEFVATLQRAVSCLSRAVLVRGRYVPGAPIRLTLSDRYVPLQGRPRIVLSLLTAYMVRERPDAPGSSIASTAGYAYQLHDRNEAEIIAFHWHPGPERVSFPHLHLAGQSTAVAIERGAHIPTGRLPFEAVVRLAIEELGVRPLRPDWQRVLDEGIARFDAGRSW